MLTMAIPRNIIDTKETQTNRVGTGNSLVMGLALVYVPWYGGHYPCLHHMRILLSTMTRMANISVSL
jgi:hypothetical protein